jgi:hypothetical protein
MFASGLNPDSLDSACDLPALTRGGDTLRPYFAFFGSASRLALNSVPGFHSGYLVACATS